MKNVNVSTLFRFFMSLLVLTSLSCQHDEPQAIRSSNSGARSGAGGPVINSVPDPLTVRYVFQSNQSRATNTGGTEGLVNTTKSAGQVFLEMEAASDKASYQAYVPATSSSPEIQGLITDQDGNTWTLYTPSPSTRTAFANKTPSYNVVKSIDWGSGPNQPAPPQKLRFTRN